MAKTVIDAYGSYNFKDKDPGIDMLRTAIQKKYGEITWKVMNKVALDTGGGNYKQVSTTTIDGWLNGDTRKPQHATMGAVAGAVDMEWALVPKKKKK